MGKTLFYRYLISYLVTLLLPLVLVMAFVFVRFTTILKEEVLSGAAESLARVETVLDMSISDLYRLPAALAVNDQLLPLSQEASSYRKYLMVRELHKYASSREIIRLLMLYRKGDPFIYSNTGIFDLS